MTMHDSNTKDREYDPHWTLTQQHSADIGELKAGQARLEVGVTSLGDRLAHGFQTLQSTLAERTRPAPPTPWVAISTLVISLVVVLGSLLAFGFGQITSSQQRENDLRFAQTYETQALAHSYAEKAIELNALTDSDQAEQIIVLRQSASRQEAQIQSLKEHIDKIDDEGSRRWIKAGQPIIPVVPAGK